MVYEMISGLPPFWDDEQPEMLEKICYGSIDDVEFDPSIFSRNCRDFVKRVRVRSVSFFFFCHVSCLATPEMEHVFFFISRETQVLRPTPEERLGYGANGTEDIKSHPWFRSIDWVKLYNKQVTPPFRPRVNDAFDMRYDMSL